LRLYEFASNGASRPNKKRQIGQGGNGGRKGENYKYPGPALCVNSDRHWARFNLLFTLMKTLDFRSETASLRGQWQRRFENAEGSDGYGQE
jgi:hypothetical protein